MNLNLYGLQNAVSTCNSLRNDRCTSEERNSNSDFIHLFFSIYSINEVMTQTCIFSSPNNHPTVLQIYVSLTKALTPRLKSMD